MEENRENTAVPENSGTEHKDEEVKKETTDGEPVIQTPSDQPETEEKPQETGQEKPEETKKDEQPETKKTEPVKKEKKVKRNHSGWKTAGKVIGVIALVFAASFGGTIAAMKWMEKRMTASINDQMEDIFGNMPNGFDGNGFDYNYNYSNGNDDSQQKTNNNSAGLGIYIRSDSDQAVIYDFTPDSLADDAGLQEGDIIISINGEETDDYDDVVEELQDYSPGDVVTVGYMRDGEKHTADVQLIDRNSPNSDFPYAGKGYMQ
ncbi:MAG: PDZ domain-containing protein [Bulleidia sp.]